MTSVLFDDPAAADVLEDLSPAALDALPFGVIRLDADGKVVLFSRTEAQASGYGDRPAIGAEFFVQVAPCMNTPAFRGRIAAAAGRGRLDLELGHTGDFGDPDRFLRIRVCSARGGGLWLLTQRE